ncbi:MAG: PLP-dependent aminotransferase family protein [Anaerolineales bacterium]
MRIPLDRQSPTPLYQQIKSHLKQGILSGGLLPGARLPASRALARDLGVNRITVETAYAELEADGLVVSRVGSGTYVSASLPVPAQPLTQLEAAWPLWQQSLRLGGEEDANVGIDEHLAQMAHPQPVRFAGGSSAPHLFPADEFRKVLQAVMRRDGIEALEYGESQGYAPLRATIAHVLASQGLQARSENILITAGSQQALSLVSQLLLKPGDTLLVESPTYGGALELFRALRFHVVGVPMDGQGMQVEHLERLLQQYHPKLIYTIPNFHNPTGTCLSGSRRRELLLLADRYNVPILEDDFVGDLRYEGSAQPSLKALDPGGRVIYTNTFSKMLMPGLRVGYLFIEGPLYERLVQFKRVNDLATSTLIQRALEAYVTVGRYQAHLRRSCHIFRKRRDAMAAAIKRYLPASVRFELPQGGLFLWVELPQDVSADDLLPLACEQGVTFMPGRRFFPDGLQGRNWMRLNFVVHAPEEIETGVARLGQALQRLTIR